MESQKSAFRHRVSKGSRFNQIYIPTGMAEIFEVGDLVKIRLIMKKERVYYSENLRKLGRISEFKENIIKQIFSLLEKFKEIKQAFVVGSFLTEKADYNDIDIMSEEIEEVLRALGLIEE